MNKNKKLSIIHWVLFFIVFLFSWWSHPNLLPKTSPDTWTYIRLANDFSSDISEIRPFFFPLLIKFCMSLSTTYWEQLLSIMQLTFHSVTCVLLFYLYLSLNLTIYVSFTLALLIGFNPSLVYYATYLLADHLLAVLTTLAWVSTIKSVEIYKRNKKMNSYIILAGIFSGLAVVTKPVSIFGIFPLLFTYILFSKVSLNIVKTTILILSINYSFNLVWEYYKTKNSNKTIEIYDHNNPTPVLKNNYFIDKWFVDNQLIVSINMTAIRGGLIDYGKGTSLYNDIKEKNLLEIARSFEYKVSYTSDDNPTYREIIKKISKEVLNDKEFAKKIINQVPFKLFFIQISNWHSFFTKRCFGPGDGSFPHMPETIRYLYIIGYSLLYRPLLIFLLLGSFIILWQRKLYALLSSSGGMLLYASLIIALLTPHGGDFPRYRVWVEYIMFFCALFPIGIVIELCGRRLYRIYGKLKL